MADVPNSAFALAFGEFIKDGRLLKRLYQREVAEHFNMSQAYYSCLEKGQRSVDLGLAMKICDFLDLDLGAFLESYKKNNLSF